MRILAAALLASVAVATPALAQDGAPLPDDFTGAHVEVITGVDRARADGEGKTGLAYGIAGGYDIQSAGGGVFGVEAEYTDSTVKSCVSDIAVVGDEACLKAKRDLYAGGRAGFVSGRTLIYGKAGYTNARAGVDYTDGTAAGTNNDSLSRNYDGLRVGAGLETNIGNFLAKAEYRYSNYEDGLSRHQGLVGLGVRF